MALPRSKYVKEGQEGVYHCFCRCVRRAFLCGYDTLTQRDFSHRKAWLVDRLRQLAAIFAIDVCAYAVMENHYHTIVRTRPDIVSRWSDLEVASRWITLFPRRFGKKSPVPTIEQQIRALADCPEHIATLRKRLCSLSWFMGRLNEFIARAANKEDDVKGRFWESRFKCQALLDEAAIAACMVYVDLNPIRGGLAATPEESDFSSIQQRILAWQKEMMSLHADCTQETQNNSSDSFPGHATMSENMGEGVTPAPVMDELFDNKDLPDSWLCPIASESGRRGILTISAAEYFDLVDISGRAIRSNKRGSIDATLAPILLRIGANPEAWPETISRFGSKFHLVAGLLANLRLFADQLGRRWLKGIAAAQSAFAPAPQRLD
jgi:REP element-mobilizing transposase RayT